VRRTQVQAALAAVCLAALAGCGGSGSQVPRGNPDARVGAQAVDAYASVELLRAQLIASSDGYFGGGSPDDARTQLQRARAAYDQLSARVRAGDPIVDREVTARFDLAAAQLHTGIPPDRYRGVVGPLFDQLMDGVAQALVPARARADAGLQAEALRRVAQRMAATYDATSASATDTRARLAFQESWGLWRRAGTLNTMLRPKLGSAGDAVGSAINNLRGAAFPNGPVPPDTPATAKVDAASARLAQALERRFGLSA
jgi:hypothetical protein